MLALPYYGSMWEGNIDEGGLVTSQFERKVTYKAWNKYTFYHIGISVLTLQSEPR